MSDTKDILLGKWHEVKGGVKKQWGKLTDDDIAAMHGRQEELAGTLQKRYGYDKTKADLEIHNWLNSFPVMEKR